MKSTTTRRFTILAAAVLVSSPTLGTGTFAGEPQQVNQGWAQVDCDKEPAGALQRAIDRARTGDSILITGTCNENVTIPIGTDRLTLDGGGSGTVNGVDPAVNTIQIRGPRGITVRQLRVTGGRAGIDISRGASALIDGNVIEGTSRNGITLGSFATANIVNNTIRNNRSHGILVTSNASGFIGFATADDTVASPNVIHSNGIHGIYVTWSSAVRIAGNDISHNTRNGVHVDHVSQANISDNQIDHNENGIFVTENSGVNLGTDNPNPGLFDSPNRTSVNNVVTGVTCRLGGYVNGRIGTLNGTAGVKSIGSSCLDGLNAADNN
jgi:parallel beta-helix repeat protein